MKAYGIEYLDTNTDWDFWRPMDYADGNIYLRRESAEAFIANAVDRFHEERAKVHDDRIKRATEHNNRLDALRAAGLDPKDFGMSGLPLKVTEPYVRDDSKTLTDEQIGYRIIEIEIED